MQDHKEAQREPAERGQSRWPFLSVLLTFLALEIACDHALPSLTSSQRLEAQENGRVTRKQEVHQKVTSWVRC